MNHSKIKLDFISSRKEYSDSFFNALSSNTVSCYEPNVDAVIITSRKLKETEIAVKWAEWYFMDMQRAIKEINMDWGLLNDYLIFQHEINSHRIPLVYSTLGTYIAFLQYRLNCMFMDRLAKRRKIKQSVFLYEHKALFDIRRYARIVLESLATFREMLVISGYLQPKEAIETQLHRLRNETVYLKGYKHALRISKLLGENGVLAAAIYALNPRLSVKKYGIQKHLNELFAYTDLRYKRILDLRKEAIPRKLDKNSLRSILRFFMKKFKWSDPHESRFLMVSSLEKLHPYIFKKLYPSPDFFSKPRVRKGGLLPKLIFYRQEGKREILISKKRDSSDYLMNFIITMTQNYGERILFYGKFFANMCPLRNFYNNSCEVCRFYSGGINCEIILNFYNQYNIGVAE